MVSVNKNSASPYARFSEGSRHCSTLAVHETSPAEPPKANQIVVRSGKGDKDRATMLPAAVKADLARHLESVQSTTQIYTHVLNRGPAGVRSPLDGMFGA